MPLTNPVIIKLNEITTMVEDKSNLSDANVEEIKSVFKSLVNDNQRYDIDEIEFWFENEGSWTKKESRVRIVNLSKYIQDKYQQMDKLRVIGDDDDNKQCCDDSQV